MDQDLIEKVMKEVTAELQSETGSASAAPAPAPADLGVTEFVGTSLGHTYGLVIANLDPLLMEGLKIKYRAIGIVGSRTGAGPQLFAMDEAVKATNTEPVLIELPRDTEGSGGHGCLIVVGADDVSDCRRAVEVCLDNIPKYFGDVYTAANNPDGHTNFLEFQYTARASMVLNKGLGAPIGKAFGFTNMCPAGPAIVIADTAVKAATVDIVGVSSPGNGGTSFSNEVIVSFTGDSGAVRQAVRAGIDVGKKLLAAFGGDIVSATEPYV